MLNTVRYECAIALKVRYKVLKAAKSKIGINHVNALIIKNY